MGLFGRKKKKESISDSFAAGNFRRKFNTTISEFVEKVQGPSDITYYPLTKIFLLRDFIYTTEDKHGQLKLTFSYDDNFGKLPRPKKRARCYLILRASKEKDYSTTKESSHWFRIDRQNPVVSVQINEGAASLDLLEAVLSALESKLISTPGVGTTSTVRTGSGYRE